jgi:hypothetical protein
MRCRVHAVAGGLAGLLLIAGCAQSVSGSAAVAPAGLASVLSSSLSRSVHSLPTGVPSGSGDATATDETDARSPDTSSATETTETSTESADSTTSDELPSTAEGPATTTSRTRLTAPSSIAGLSADCNKVLAAVTAFSGLVQSVSNDPSATISKATVDAALKQMPASGLPSRPQADINVLRTTVSGSAGKSATDMLMSLGDGKAVAALQDISSWTTSSCI